MLAAARASCALAACARGFPLPGLVALVSRQVRQVGSQSSFTNAMPNSDGIAVGSSPEGLNDLLLPSLPATTLHPHQF